MGAYQGLGVFECPDCYTTGKVACLCVTCVVEPGYEPHAMLPCTYCYGHGFLIFVRGWFQHDAEKPWCVPAQPDFLDHALF